MDRLLHYLYRGTPWQRLLTTLCVSLLAAVTLQAQSTDDGSEPFFRVAQPDELPYGWEFSFDPSGSSTYATVKGTAESEPVTLRIPIEESHPEGSVYRAKSLNDFIVADIVDNEIVLTFADETNYGYALKSANVTIELFDTIANTYLSRSAYRLDLYVKSNIIPQGCDLTLLTPVSPDIISWWIKAPLKVGDKFRYLITNYAQVEGTALTTRIDFDYKKSFLAEIVDEGNKKYLDVSIVGPVTKDDGTICVRVMIYDPKASPLSHSSYIIGTVQFTSTAENELKVLQDSIVVPTNTQIRLSNLIDAGVVEGAGGGNNQWIISASNTATFEVDNDIWPFFNALEPSESDITYTNRDSEELHFTIKALARLGANSYVLENVDTVYIDEWQTITIPDSYIPLNEFTVSSVGLKDWIDARINIQNDGNKLMLKGISAGKRILEFSHRFGTSSDTIVIAERPGKPKFTVIEPSIVVPTFVGVKLSDLVKTGVIEGEVGQDSDWTISATNEVGFWIYNQYHTFTPAEPVTETVTYTHKTFQNVKINIEVNAKPHPIFQISPVASSLELGVPVSVTMPDECVPLSEFTFSKDDNGAEGQFDIEINGNTLTITGTAVGEARIVAHHRFGDFSIDALIKEDPAVEKVEIAADDEKTQELIESGVIAIIDPNEPDAPADPDKPAPEITFTPAVETKDETTGEIVSVEPELLTFTVTSQVEEIPLKVETKEMESVEGRYVAVSSNEAVAIASLDENGNLVIKRNATIGTARIIIIFVETPPVASRSRSISARNGNASEPLKEIIVQVNPAAETTLVLSEHSITLTEGGSIAITASLKDAEGNDSEQEFSVEWSSSDIEVATVDKAGTITAVKAGKATITATCGKLSATCEVTVSEPEAPEVTEINLDTEKISGVEGSTYHLQADVDDLTWSSSDESVAVVDQNGIVTLVGAGRAIITATAPNGVKATCEVVVEAASGINGVEADTEAAFAPVYDLTGRLVARTPEQMAALRAGIYIQAGRKIYISK